MNTAEFCFCNRVTFRKDRNGSLTGKCRGGGVFLAVKNFYSVSEVRIFDDEQEALCIQIKLKGNQVLFVVLIYIVPNSPREVYEKFYEKIENNLISIDNSEVIVIGDFNIPGYVNTLSCNSIVNDLRSFLAFNHCQQVNQIRNQNNVILDLVLASFDNVCVESAGDFLVPVVRHHPCLSVGLLTESPAKFCKIQPSTKFNFRKANFYSMYNLFRNQDWDFLYGFKDVNKALETFYKILESIFVECVPKSTQSDKKYPIWFNIEIIKLLKEKHKCRIKSSKTKSLYWKTKYTNLRTTIKNKIQLAHKKYLIDVENSLVSNPKYFWSYLKGLKDSPDLLNEMNLDDNIYSGTQNVADGFAGFFKSVYIDVGQVNCDSTKAQSHFCEKLVTRADIENALKKIKPNKAIGPDGIPAYIFKGCAEHLLSPLQFLFNLVIKTSIYPDKWKVAKVIPIYKNGIRQDIRNYRPISIVCAVSKIFEVIIFEILYSEVAAKLSPNQHGFLPKKSTFTNLACFSQYIHNALNNKTQVDVIYTDMEKAFDRVSHCVIINALSDMEVSPFLIKLTSSYLIGRFQYVEIKGCKSVLYQSTSGVPQGSNLGPLLFIIAINSILCNVKNCMALLFADDFKLFLEIISSADCELLQSEFSNVVNWCQENSFKLNSNKCACMSFTLNKKSIDFNYTMSGEKLDKVIKQKDLGVIFDSSLSFSEHIISKIQSAQKIAGFIARNTKTFRVDVSLHLFDSLVLPILEYGSLIWSPQYNVWINIIEGVQRKFLKTMYYRRFGVYPQRGCANNFLLGVFNRLSLSKRRVKIFLCTMFKILKGDIDCPDILEQLPFSVNRCNSRTTNIFYLAFPRTNLFKSSPIYGLCNLFNLYASDIDIDLINFKTFKNLIDKKLRQS